MNVENQNKKMKTKLFILVAALAVAFTLTAAAQTNAAPPVAQLTPDAVTSINNLLPLIPAAYQPAVIKILALIGTLGVVGRVLLGFRNGGIWGVLTGLLGGTNTPKPADPKTTSQGAGANALRNSAPLILACLILPASLLFTGCKSTQVVTFTKGTGLDATIPLGFNGNNIFQLSLRVGQFYNATAIQPVSTNKVFTPQVALASGTDGNVTAPQVGGVATASVQGGDFFNAALGAGAMSDVSNVVSHAEANIQP